MPVAKTGEVRQTYEMKVPPSKVWKMLVDPKLIEEWSGTRAVMDAKAGTKFSLWGGDIYGENVEVVPEKKLVQLWREGHWKEPSTVTFSLRKHGASGTTLELVHTGIPADEVDDIASGWNEFYLGAIKEKLG